MVIGDSPQPLMNGHGAPNVNITRIAGKQRRGQSANFFARPRVLPGNNRGAVYREPQMIKVAPQNIMHDRRIVRGNTFAALVIPISKWCAPAPPHSGPASAFRGGVSFI